MKPIDVTGYKFNRLTAIKLEKRRDIRESFRYGYDYAFKTCRGYRTMLTLMDRTSGQHAIAWPSEDESTWQVKYVGHDSIIYLSQYALEEYFEVLEDKEYEHDV